jgi:2-C-methyl-D-erythritol 4-phosphate cytidylyltransferase
MHLLIPAAGVGSRMREAWTQRGETQRNKLLLTLLGQPILAWTLLAAQAAPAIEWIGLVSQPEDWPDFERMIASLRNDQRPTLALTKLALTKLVLAKPVLTKPVVLIQGGETRQESVYNGLQALPEDAKTVLIHDGARCLATPDLFARCGDALETCEGLIAAVPVKDTIKVVGPDHRIQSTPDRDRLWAAQTPQGFAVAALKDCHDQGRREGRSVTDDAALFEAFGRPVQIVLGEETNLKVTTPVDLAIAEFILRQRLEGVG